MDDRIQIVGGPWPARIGCKGVTVEMNVPNHYPWSKLSRGEVVVRLDDDPLDATSGDPAWTCVLRREACTFSGGALTQGPDTE